MSDGLKTIVARCGASPGGPPQAELFGQAPAAPAEAEERGVGRPKGSLNKRSRDWQRWWRESGKRHPLEFLAEVLTSAPDALRERYGGALVAADDGTVAGMTSKDVLAMQIRAAEVALPYLEQKLPIAVEDVSEGKRPVIVIGAMTPQQAATAGQTLGLGLRLRGEQNQRVIDASAMQSDDTEVGQTKKA